MDQKRALWIIAAAGVFLLVVLGSAFLLYTPAPRAVKSVASLETAKIQPAAQTAPKSSSGWTQTDNNQVAHTNELTVYSDKTVVYGKDNGETTIDLNALRSEIEKAQTPQNINITLNVPETKTEPVPPAQVLNETKVTAQTPVKEEVKEVKVETPVVKQAEVKTAKVETKPVTTKTTTAKTTTTTTTKTTAKTEAKPAAEPTKYWIQAAAFSTKKSAENAREKLDASKIPADIFTYTDASGKTFYRVRVGPYTTKSEAEYWKSKIVQISEFKEGYITTK